MVKWVIAIGNRLMMDDAAGICVVENIKNQLENCGVKVVIGETYIDYAFSKLNKHDEFYIVDATCYGAPPGTITLKTIEEIKNSRVQSYTIHSLGLIDMINLNKIEVKGYFIGIEIDTIDINLRLSTKLQEQFSVISDKVLSLII